MKISQGADKALRLGLFHRYLGMYIAQTFRLLVLFSTAAAVFRAALLPLYGEALV